MNVIDLLGELGVLPKKVSSTKGGEYHSSCPDQSCHGKDRFCIWPKEGPDGRYWCRKCLRSGDAIQFCRDFMGMDFKTACGKMGKGLSNPRPRNLVSLRPKFIPRTIDQPSDQWCQRASAFVSESHRYLLMHPHLLNEEKDRGLTLQSIEKFQLGWNPADIFEPRQSWALSDVSEATGARVLCLPQGIVLPSFRDGSPIRLKIRRHNWKPDDEYPKYHIIVGGMTCPTVYGDTSKPVVIVEAELDAMLIQQVAADVCCCIALGGVSIRPDIVVDRMIRQSPCILFALDCDDAGKKAYTFWQSTYKDLRPWLIPRGKSPGDAYLLGVDLRRWIEAGIRRGML